MTDDLIDTDVPPADITPPDPEEPEEVKTGETSPDGDEEVDD